MAAALAYLVYSIFTLAANYRQPNEPYMGAELDIEPDWRNYRQPAEPDRNIAWVEPDTESDIEYTTFNPEDEDHTFAEAEIDEPTPLASGTFLYYGCKNNPSACDRACKTRGYKWGICGGSDTRGKCMCY